MPTSDIEKAFRDLRAALDADGLHTLASEDKYGFFTVYAIRDPATGNPMKGFFVSGRPGVAVFRWGIFHQHTMEDIPGAAKRIAADVRTQAEMFRVAESLAAEIREEPDAGGTNTATGDTRDAAAG